jgi:hypothetical protein
VFAVCQSGSPAFQAIALVNGAAVVSAWAPAPGDVIQVSVSESTTATKATFTDVTKKLSATESSPTGGTNSFIIDGITALSTSSGQLGVPPFGTDRFSLGKIDGDTVAASGAVAVSMQTSGAVLQIATGTLNSTGNAWNEIFKHS